MGIERSKRPVAVSRISTTARRLLDASTLCAIATAAPNGRAHINTAYFAWSPDFHVVWLSEPRARHSRNIRANESVAIAVYDSTQTWGKPDRGIQIFGSAREVTRSASNDVEKLYAARFSEYHETELSAYRFYVLRPQRIKLFDEREFGTGVFVTARPSRSGRLIWERTEIYRPAA
jgi:uncharacterized protein YhbP (UPF0306 family)